MLHRILDKRSPFPAVAPATAPLDDTFAAVAAGEGRAVILRGRPGGLADRAAGAGLEVLRARGGASDDPFGTAITLLGPAVARAGDDLFTGAASLTRGLFAGEAPPAGEFALVHGLYWLTAGLADRRPLALLVEDARRADEPSLRLCAYLAQRIDELPVALVLA